MDKTKIYEKNEFSDALALQVLKEVYQILEERGYNSVNQIVGYLMSGDPGYITSYNGARTLIMSVDRAKLIETMLKNICDI